MQQRRRTRRTVSGHQEHRDALVVPARMSGIAEKTGPALWEAVKDEVPAGSKGGKKGQWSARKAQLAVAEYRKRGGGYVDARDPHNSLHALSEEDWGTKSGGKSGDTHERYLPKQARGDQ